MVRVRSGRGLVAAAGLVLMVALAGCGNTSDSGAASKAASAGGASAASPAGSASASAKAAAAASAAAKLADKPLWTALKPAQQAALSPLAGQWDTVMGGQQKQKWLEIANRFPSMTPDEQQRVQQRMREWVKLTPEQRRMVRENYARAKKLEPSQKSAQWQQYQQLPEEEKQKLAADADKTKHVADPPPPSQSRVKTVAPIKSGVIPQATPPASAPSGSGPGVIVITPAAQSVPPAASAASAPGNGK